MPRVYIESAYVNIFMQVLSMKTEFKKVVDLITSVINEHVELDGIVWDSPGNLLANN